MSSKSPPTSNFKNSSTPPLRILLIEENEAYGNTLKETLSNAGHDITWIHKSSDKDSLSSIDTFDVVLEEQGHFYKNNTNNKEEAERYNFSNIISESKPMLAIFETVKRLTDFKTTILISGESGTGKELLARAIHYNSSRKGQKFVAINCGAIPENLIESELFGHKMGSFTDAVRDRVGLFEEANNGTIFLDEIGELPLSLQVKLLRVLQEQTIRRIGEEFDRKIDVRILAASHQDLEQSVKSGMFREDLFYRLNVVHIHLPALRERTEDIPVLISHFIKKHNHKLGTKIKGVDDEVLHCFRSYPWRGNIRELENAIERGIILAEGDLITLNCLPERIRKTSSKATGSINTFSATDGDSLSIKSKVRDLETNLILRALEQTGGNRTHAAKILEISHRTLLYKLKEYNISEAFKS